MTMNVDSVYSAAAPAPSKSEQAQQQEQLSLHGRSIEMDEPILRPNPDRFVMFPI
ncbi:hypothetical protein GGI02_006157, partial [Coemansia sp. RSA 2322]